MTQDTKDRSRFREHESKDDVMSMLGANGLGLDDCFYLSAISISPMTLNLQGVETLVNLPTKSVRLYYLEEGKTGYFQARGGIRLVFLNENDIVDYDLISHLHTVPDADVYLAISEPYEGNRDFDRLGEWYRDESYPNHFKE